MSDFQYLGMGLCFSLLLVGMSVFVVVVVVHIGCTASYMVGVTIVHHLTKASLKSDRKVLI